MTSLALAADRPAPTRLVALWLLLCAGMVFAMAVIGAITRLTESGLSMVEWKPVIGVLPPLSEAEWQRVFNLYRRTPEYWYHNADMSLDAFKGIYWWEWFHRLWGHLIGLAFTGGFLVLWGRGLVPRALWRPLAGLLLLGASQGLAGWFMVMSGLVDRPSVSHYRLALHLGLAVLIFALLLRCALRLLDPAGGSGRHRRAPALRRQAGVALALVSLTLVWGAFVAGLDAGMIHNTWPLMGDRLIPAEIGALAPAWLNPVENPVAVQFVHRWLAVITGLVVLAWAWRAGRAGLPARGRRLAAALSVAVVVQIALGIFTLLSVVAIPLAAAHQAGALVLVALLVWVRHDLRPA